MYSHCVHGCRLLSRLGRSRFIGIYWHIYTSMGDLHLSLRTPAALRHYCSRYLCLRSPVTYASRHDSDVSR